MTTDHTALIAGARVWERAQVLDAPTVTLALLNKLADALESEHRRAERLSTIPSRTLYEATLAERDAAYTAIREALAVPSAHETGTSTRPWRVVVTDLHAILSRIPTEGSET